MVVVLWLDAFAKSLEEVVGPQGFLFCLSQRTLLHFTHTLHYKSKSIIPNKV